MTAKQETRLMLLTVVSLTALAAIVLTDHPAGEPSSLLTTETLTEPLPLPASSLTVSTTSASLPSLPPRPDTSSSTPGPSVTEPATTPLSPPTPSEPPPTEPPPTSPPELREEVTPDSTVVLSGGYVARCGEDDRASGTCPEGAPETSVITAPPTTASPPAICHSDDGNARAVSAAIRAHFPSGVWGTMCRIAWCESNFNPSAHNRSGATGVWQIMPSWFSHVPGADPWSIDGSARLARYVYDHQGLNAWSCY